MKKAISMLIAATLFITGCSDGNAQSEEVSAVFSDVNGDGAIDNLDAVMVLRSDAGINPLTAEQAARADVNGDGVADNLDASFLIRYDAGLYPNASAPSESAVAEVPEGAVDYVLGLKSFAPTSGFYAADGADIASGDEALKARAAALFANGGKAITLETDEAFSPEGVPASVIDQAYKIEVGDSIKITARTDRALYYGAMTVSRYFKLQGGMKCGVYTDWPDLAERCLHLDIARKYFTKDWIIDMIRSAATFGINAVELHFSESEGFRIQCDTDPSIMSDEYLTKDEVREIMASAAELYVEIIPAFDSPGHLMQILSAHPEYSLTDVDGYNSPKTLDITNPEAVNYMKSLLDEYAELFADCEKFSIGGDESFGWSNVPRMQFSAWQILEDYAKATYGEKANAHDAYVGYVNDIADYMEAKGFKVRAWNDGLMRTAGQAAVNVPSKDIEVLYWTNNGTLKATLVDDYLQNGYKVINVNENYMYYVLKDGYDEPSAERIYNEWNGGVFTGADKEHGINYVSDLSKLEGVLESAYFCIWCDKQETQTPEQVREGSRIALRAMAVKAWNSSPHVDYYSFIDQQKAIGGK